jgi:hypothetical protein
MNVRFSIQKPSSRAIELRHRAPPRSAKQNPSKTGLGVLIREVPKALSWSMLYEEGIVSDQTTFCCQIMRTQLA